MQQDAGELDRRITLLPPVKSRAGNGETTLTYPSPGVGPIWARVRGSTANEQIRNGQNSTAAPYAIRIRYMALTGVPERYRITYEGKTLEISSVVEIGRREWLDIVATELRQ